MSHKGQADIEGRAQARSFLPLLQCAWVSRDYLTGRGLCVAAAVHDLDRPADVRAYAAWVSHIYICSGDRDTTTPRLIDSPPGWINLPAVIRRDGHGGDRATIGGGRLKSNRDAWPYIYPFSIALDLWRRVVNYGNSR
jgi:hypothetical protein